MRLRFLHLLFIASILGSAFGMSHAKANDDRPNVLLILADNWRWPNAGALGDPLAKTPTFDRIAREGVLFTHVFNPVPSCSPTRSCLLTGRYAHEIGERASLYSGFPKDTPVVTDLLRNAGYQTGYSGKPWGPGNHEISGWKENPVGTKFASFDLFLKQTETSKPFFFWLGNTDTATKAGRLPYLDRAKSILSADQVPIPPELPDCPELRQDLLNYYGGIMTMDDEAGAAVQQLEDRGLLDDTIVIYASDNGWQMPRGLANCYDSGSRVPMAIRWGQHLKPGREVDAFINNAEIGPTILELTGIARPPEMTLPRPSTSNDPPSAGSMTMNMNMIPQKRNPKRAAAAARRQVRHRCTAIIPVCPRILPRRVGFNMRSALWRLDQPPMSMPPMPAWRPHQR